MKIKYSGYPEKKTFNSYGWLGGWLQWSTGGIDYPALSIGRPWPVSVTGNDDLSSLPTHAMPPIGASVDNNGRPILIFQNSWGPAFNNGAASEE